MVGSTVLSTVTGSILNVAIDTVRDLLMEEGRFLHGVKFEVEEIERELRRMKVFLEYADDRQAEEELIRQRVEEIRKLANEVEVVLETFANKVKSTKKRKGVKNALKVADIFNKSIALHKVGSEIVSIRSKITNLTNSLPIYDLTHLKLQAQSSDSTQCLTEVVESTDTKDRISDVPESSQTASLREHVSSDIVGSDEHGSVQIFWLGPSPTEIFSKHLRHYDAIKKINEVQAATIEIMEAEIKLWKKRNDLMEKKVQNIEKYMLSRDSMTDLPLDAHSNSRQVPDASSANQPSLAAEVEPMHQEYSSSNATPSISNEVKSLTKKVKKKHAITAIPKVLKKVTLAKFL